MSSILEAGLWPRIGLDHAPRVNERFGRDPRRRAQFAGLSLLYDTLVIPTNDFGLVPVLLEWLGLRSFRAALERNEITFLRRRDCLAYVGAGHGVSSFVVQPGGGRKFDWWQMAMFGNRADAIELQIRHCTWPIPDAEKSSLTKAILVSSLDFEIENDVFTKHVSEAAYGDIIGDEELRDLISRYCGGNHVDLLRLPGIRDDQVRISAEDGPSDAAGLVLAVAELNLEIAMSIRLNGCDISTFNQAGRLLRHKLARSRFPEVAIDGFSRMLELHRLPDIPAAVAAGRVAVSDIWTARNTPAARKFRKWLAAAELFDSKDLAALYVDAIGREPLISRLPVKTVRWLLTLGAEYVATSYLDASIGGVAGMALSATDGLFVDAWLRGYSPRLFIDELKQLRFEPRLVK